MIQHRHITICLTYKPIRRFLVSFILCLCVIAPHTLHASFIESSIGFAVVDDATATDHNPAALTLLNHSQIIALGSAAYYHDYFSGQLTQPSTGYMQSGTATELANHYVPALYLAIPTTDKVSIGVAVTSNIFETKLDKNALIRYIDANEGIRLMNYIFGIGVQINAYLSLGAGVTYSVANSFSNPITGLPNLNIPDAQSHNVAKSAGAGGNVGFLLKPNQATLIGLNYQSTVSYQFNGTSSFNGTNPISSNQFNFHYWEPARTVLSISYDTQPSLGFITTIQYNQWSILDNISVHNVATQIAGHSVILANNNEAYNFHDTWTFTVGSILNINPEWILRIATSYDQSPGNETYQIIDGDDLVAGASIEYNVNKNMAIDFSYAHAFQLPQRINVDSNTFRVTGTTRGYHDAISLRLSLNME